MNTEGDSMTNDDWADVVSDEAARKANKTEYTLLPAGKNNYTIDRVFLGEDKQGRKVIDFRLKSTEAEGVFRLHLQPMSDSENAMKGFKWAFDSACQALEFDNRSVSLVAAIQGLARKAPSYRGRLVEAFVKHEDYEVNGETRVRAKVYLNKLLGTEELATQNLINHFDAEFVDVDAQEREDWLTETSGPAIDAALPIY